MVSPKNDARHFSDQTLEQMRQQAVRMEAQGQSQQQIAQWLVVHRNTVSRWLKAIAEGGAEGLRAKTRGVAPGSRRSLEPEQEALIQRCLLEKTPDQFRFEFALWTRPAVQELIEYLCGVRMPIRTEGTYLKRWGFTVQKPLTRAYEQCPQMVQRWLDESYPKIAARAEAEGAEIHWGDETGVRNHCQHERGYAPRGATPVRERMAKRFSTNIISSVTNRGKLRFMGYEGSFTAKTFIRFLRRLIEDTEPKVFLIVDNLRVHHAKLVREWAERHRERIELFYLPAYTPELNPDEYLNNDLKGGIRRNPAARDVNELKAQVHSHMRMLQKRPHRVAAYFRHPKIRYAA